MVSVAASLFCASHEHNIQYAEEVLTDLGPVPFSTAMPIGSGFNLSTGTYRFGRVLMGCLFGTLDFIDYISQLRIACIKIHLWNSRLINHLLRRSYTR